MKQCKQTYISFEEYMFTGFSTDFCKSQNPYMKSQYPYTKLQFISWRFLI